MSVLYIEPFSGISGDMLLGAFCDLADDYESIKQLPEQLNLPEAEIVIEEVFKNGISCKQVKVIDRSEKNTTPQHRHLKEIHQIIDSSSINETSKEMAKEIFSIIGMSESKIHKVPLEKIHFHEISGVDSIIDIVGCVVLLNKLAVNKAYSDPVCTGFGTVNTQHGILPVPAPATADLLIGIPVYKGEEEGEKVTPTGAAILKYLDPEFNVPVGKINKVGYGPGQKEFNSPNVLRISLFEEREDHDREKLYLIECNIDDSSPEYLGSDFQKDLLKNGALDFYFTQVQMKKSRPGIMISVLVEASSLEKINNFILEKTSTIGLRFYPISRSILKRRSFEMDTKYGKVNVKEVIKPSGEKRFKIEYESLYEISSRHNIDIQQLQSELMSMITALSNP